MMKGTSHQPHWTPQEFESPFERRRRSLMLPIMSVLTLVLSHEWRAHSAPPTVSRVCLHREKPSIGKRSHMEMARPRA